MATALVIEPHELHRGPADTGDDRKRAGTIRWLDRRLHPLTGMTAAESFGALLLAADVFVLLASYYLLKTVREALILSEGSAEVKSYAAGAQALLLLGLVPLYGMVASRVSRTQLVNGVTLFFVSNLAGFHVLASVGVPIGVPFFLWVGVFNLMVVAQFWGFANDLCSIERGQRLFPFVAAGGSLGAWLGAKAASHLMALHRQPTDLLLLAAAGLLFCAVLNLAASRWSGGRGSDPARHAEAAPGHHNAFQLIIGDRYLRLIALLVILVNVVNTVGEFLLGRLVASSAAVAIATGTAHGLTKPQLIGVFYGDFFGWVNLVSLAIQLFLVSQLFKRIGVAGALFVLPIIACGVYGTLACVPALGFVRYGKILENSTDYSLQNTSRHALFLPTSREAKYKATQAIDAFCWRAGDLVQAFVVYAGVRLAFDVRQFALLNEVLVAVWLVLVVGIYREHRRTTRLLNRTPLAA